MLPSCFVSSSRRTFFVLASLMLLCVAFAGETARAQYLQPTVCVEYPPNQSTNFVARFGYVNPEASTVSIGSNTASNYLFPIRNPPGEPSTFYSGATQSAFAVLVPNTEMESWRLTTGNAPAISALYALTTNSAQGSTTSYVPSPTCPVVIRPATLSYSAAGTYTNVFLGQVDSGPNSNGVTLSAIAANTGVSFTNLTYVPADTTNPTSTLNPNSIYGTVIVTADTAPNAGIYLQLSVNGAPAASAAVPIKVRM